MNILYDARYLWAVLWGNGPRIAGKVFMRGLRGGSVFCWLVVALVFGLALGWFTADFGIVPK